MQKTTALMILLSILLLSCNEKGNGNNFEITGITQGLENGTKLLLVNILNDEIIDSTSVKDNRFRISANLSKSPLQAILRTKDYSEYRFIWLENEKMQFNASNSNFRKAHVTGSKTEKLSQQLAEKTNWIDAQIEDLKEMVKNGSLSMDKARSEADSLRKRRIQHEIDFVKNNPNSIVSAYILSVYATTWGKERTSKLF